MDNHTRLALVSVTAYLLLIVAAAFATGCAAAPVGAWKLGNSGFWQGEVFVTRVEIREAEGNR